jgi:alkanesulfonate monooxygenase SsuD/methylene tetrahydromethanopterin reductase-like flavin-dependent oxidoreductase (luciferase family)
VCRGLRERGVTTWTAGRVPEIRQVAADHADALNVWGSSPGEVVEVVEDMRARSGRSDYPVTWGGQVLVGRTDTEAESKVRRYGLRPHLVHGTVAAVARHFEALAEAGVTYAVCAPLDVGEGPAAYETLAEVKEGLT